jgi:hypothetical protein
MKGRFGKQAPRVALIGFEGASLHTLQYYFEHKRANAFQMVTDIRYADCVVFNADQPRTKDSLQEELEKKIAKPSIVVSIKPIQWHRSVTLLKPFSSITLDDAIKSLGELMAAEEQDKEQSSYQSALEELAKANSEPKESIAPEVVGSADNFTNGKITSFMEAAKKRQAKQQDTGEYSEITPDSDGAPSADSNAAGVKTSLPDARVGSVRAQVVARLNTQAPQPGAQEITALAPNAAPQSDVSVEVSPDTATEEKPAEAPKADKNKADQDKRKQQQEELKLKAQKLAKLKKLKKAQEEQKSAASTQTAAPAEEASQADSTKGNEKVELTSLSLKTLFGHLPDLDWLNPGDRRRMMFSLDGMLLPWVTEAMNLGRKYQKAYRVQGLNIHLEYLPWTDCFVVNADHELLNAMMSSRFSLGELSVADGVTTEADLIDGLGTEFKIISADDFMWLAGLWTSHGRLMPEDDPTRTRLLSRIPECARELQVPELHAILKMWRTRPMSAFQVARELQVPQRYVFGVMTACTSAGLFNY